MLTVSLTEAPDRLSSMRWPVKMLNVFVKVHTLDFQVVFGRYYHDWQANTAADGRYFDTAVG